MKIIIKDALIHNIQSDNMIKFIQTHPFFNNGMSSIEIADAIHLQSHNNRKNDLLKQLELYLNRQTNLQLFGVLQYIINNPGGVSYTQITQKFKIDKINVSHYCCRLRKMKFIRWNHLKEGMGIIVYPNTQRQPQYDQPIELNHPNITNDTFCFRQLSMLDNIWVNVSSAQTLLKGGISNQDIKHKIGKNAETKMVRRILENFKGLEKVAERQGKVYEFKYKNEIQHIKQEINKKKNEEDQIEPLEPEILKWLQGKIPQFQGQNFMIDLINNRLKEYHSSVGTKLAKRQCTPLKLSRYIKVLNHLHNYGPQTEVQLRKFVVQYEKDLNIGTMHKRSSIGILDGLKKLQIIREDNQIYYPSWISSQRTPSKQLQINKSKTKKKTKVEQQQSNQAVTQFKKISSKKHRLQLFAKYLQLQLLSIFNKTLKTAFYRIKNPRRKKLQINPYLPQKNIINIIENSLIVLPQIQSTTSQQLIQQIDQYINQNGVTQNKIDISKDIIKYIRKNPIMSFNNLTLKFGKNWKEKLQELIQKNLLKLQNQHAQLSINQNQYLI